MENDIPEVLSQKRAWQKSDGDRRKKNGSREDRKLTADCIRAGRSTDKRKDEIEHKAEFHASMLFICILLGLLMMLCFMGKAHAEDINMDVIADIESSNEPLAKNGDHIGMYQISPGVLRDYNNHHDEYKMDDMYIEGLSYMVATWYFNEEIPSYLTEYNIPDTTTSRIICWNWGIGHLRKWFKSGSHWNRLPKETRNYIKKYFRENVLIGNADIVYIRILPYKFYKKG